MQFRATVASRHRHQMSGRASLFIHHLICDPVGGTLGWTRTLREGLSTYAKLFAKHSSC